MAKTKTERLIKISKSSEHILGLHKKQERKSTSKRKNLSFPKKVYQDFDSSTIKRARNFKKRQTLKHIPIYQPDRKYKKYDTVLKVRFYFLSTVSPDSKELRIFSRRIRFRGKKVSESELKRRLPKVISHIKGSFRKFNNDKSFNSWNKRHNAYMEYVGLKDANAYYRGSRRK